MVKLPHKLSICELCGPHVICGYCGNNCCNGSSGRQVKGADCDCVEAYEQQERFYIEQAKKLPSGE